MKTTLKQHILYSQDPCLFMKERWMGPDSFNQMQYNYIKPFEYQLEFIKNIHEEKNNIVLKSRQMHVSSMMALYIAWYAIFNYDKQIVIVSPTSNSSKRILDQIKIILKNYSVDDENNGKVTKTYFHWEDDFIINNKNVLELKNGCRINSISPTRDSGKGYGIDFLFIDEAAYIKHFEEINMALVPALMVNKDSKYVIASTPQDNSIFNKVYISATSDKNNFNPIKLHWSLHPFYSIGMSEDRNRESPYQYKSPWFDDLVKNRYRGSQTYVEQELECVVNFKEEPAKTKTISLRIDDELYKKIKYNLHEEESASDYIRKLIEKDFKWK